MRAHRQAQALFRRQALQHLGGQAAGFGAEQKRIAGDIARLVVALAAACAEREQASWRDRGQGRLQRGVDLQRGVFVVVQAGAS